MGGETWASPTRLALVLAGGGGGFGGGGGATGCADAGARGTVIVETNYRVGMGCGMARTPATVGRRRHSGLGWRLPPPADLKEVATRSNYERTLLLRGVTYAPVFQRDARSSV